MSAIIPFQFEAHAVRVQVDELGQPWFNATDVCDALEMGNPSQAIKSHVDAEDLQKLETLTAGGRQRQNHVNESGLYALILGSTKDAAKRFKRWVTSEVLPAIRKTGETDEAVAARIEEDPMQCRRPAFYLGDDKATPAEIRVGSPNAVAIYLNGKKLFGREEYHHGDQMDYHVGKGELTAGENIRAILELREKDDSVIARELQALLDDLRRDEEGRGDRFFALTLLAQSLESTELVERMQGNALHVLR